MTGPVSLHVLQGRDAEPGNLPAQRNTFVGREREVEAILDLLQSAPLVTITGPPGAGKTRLAVRVAHAAPRYSDGAWFIDLAPLTSEHQVAEGAARELGMQESSGADWRAAVCDHLASAHALLVLDNCEHVVGGAAALADALLARCPSVRVLATSRERLRIEGETTWALEPLSKVEAEELFTDRARAASAAFTTSGSAAAVAEICSRLEGLPLAIELAAARVATLPLEAIRALLGDRLQFLKGGSRLAAPRHRSLAAALAWSYSLLEPAEQRVLRRLGVFAGPFSLSAALAVGEGESHDDVVSSLSGLAEKSLVTADGDRFRLLDTIRVFAAEQLRAEGEGDAARARHAAHFAGLAEELEGHRGTPGEARLIQLLLRDMADVYAALQWSFANDADLAARLALGAAVIWFVSGDFIEGRRWFDRALALPVRDAALRTRVLVEAAIFSEGSGELNMASDRYQAALALARQLGALDSLGRCLENYGSLLARQDQLDAARDALEESIRVIEGLDGDSSSAHLRLAVALFNQGDVTGTLGHVHRGIAIARDRSASRVLVPGLALLAAVSLSAGELAPAQAAVSECVALCREAGDRWAVGYALDSAAMMAAARSEYSRAVMLVSAASQLRRQGGFQAEPRWSDFVATLTEPAAASLAEPQLTNAREQGRALGFEEALALAAQEGPANKGAGGLTRRQIEIATLVAQGLTAKEIASRLFITVRTVENHVDGIRNKLGVRSRSEITAWVVQQRWLSR